MLKVENTSQKILNEKTRQIVSKTDENESCKWKNEVKKLWQQMKAEKKLRQSYSNIIGKRVSTFTFVETFHSS